MRTPTRHVSHQKLLSSSSPPTRIQTQATPWRETQGPSSDDTEIYIASLAHNPTYLLSSADDSAIIVKGPSAKTINGATGSLLRTTIQLLAEPEPEQEKKALLGGLTNVEGGTEVVGETLEKLNRRSKTQNLVDEAKSPVSKYVRSDKTLAATFRTIATAVLFIEILTVVLQLPCAWISFTYEWKPPA